MGDEGLEPNSKNTEKSTVKSTRSLTAVASAVAIHPLPMDAVLLLKDAGYQFWCE
tara:strand:+ start:129860 stop:130024 length:165 start_codon:yes stop_codon:yes gene_type:complete